MLVVIVGCLCFSWSTCESVKKAFKYFKTYQSRDINMNYRITVYPIIPRARRLAGLGYCYSILGYSLGVALEKPTQKKTHPLLNGEVIIIT